MKGELHLPDLPEVPVALSPLSPPLDDQQRRTRPGWGVRVAERIVGDSREVWLDGQAQVISESAGELPIQMNGEHLHALPKARQVDSKNMVIVRQGDSEFNADGLEYDDTTRLLTLHGNVHALMQPQ